VNFFCIADEDTVRGFRLAGIDGRAVASVPEAEEAFDQAVRREGLGVLIMTDAVATDVRGRVDAVRMGQGLPLIVEVPGLDGPLPGRKTLRQFVQEAVGIRVGQEEEEGPRDGR